MIKEQTIPFHINKENEITYPKKEELDDISSKAFKEHENAYKELAK